MASTSKLREFDPMRVVSACAVIFIHAASTAMLSADAPQGWDALHLLDSFAFFAVPAFVFMAAALSWARCLDSEQTPYLRFMGRRLSALLPAYLVWSVVYWSIAHFGLGFKSSAAGAAVTPWGFIMSLLSGDAWNHLYFVPVVVLVYALTPLARPILRWRPAAVFVIPIAGRLLLWGVQGASGGRPDSMVVNSFVLLLPSAAAGAWYAVRRERSGASGWWEMPGWPAMLVIGVGLHTAIAVGAFAWLPAEASTVAASLWPIPVTIGLLGACARIARLLPRVAAAAEALAPLTYLVYLSHQAMLILLYRVVKGTRFKALWSDPRLLTVKWGYAVVISFVLASALVYLGRRVRQRIGSAEGNR